MGNDVFKAHTRLGSPLGDDKGLEVVADWAGWELIAHRDALETVWPYLESDASCRNGMSAGRVAAISRVADALGKLVPGRQVPEPERPVYLAVPYSHPDVEVRDFRFRMVNRVAAHLMGRGTYVFSPVSHLHPISLAGDLPLDWEYWKGYCKAMLGTCGRLVVLKLDGWNGSSGVRGEMEIADELGIPVDFMDVPETCRESDGAEVCGLPTAPLYPGDGLERRLEQLAWNCRQEDKIPSQYVGENFDVVFGCQVREYWEPDPHAHEVRTDHLPFWVDAEAFVKGLPEIWEWCDAQTEGIRTLIRDAVQRMRLEGVPCAKVRLPVQWYDWLDCPMQFDGMEVTRSLDAPGELLLFSAGRHGVFRRVALTNE